MKVLDSLNLLLEKVEAWLNTVRAQQLFFVIFIAGVILRLRPYLTARSLWLDESFIALNIRYRDFAGLLEPLDYSQVAPFGFLLTTKLFVNLFGENELALRLYPLLCGALSIGLIYLVGKQLINSRVGLISAFLLCFAALPIYYSNELKQYIGDIFFSLLIYYLYFRYFDKNPGVKTTFLLGFMGAIGVFFSNVAIIILAALGIYSLWKLFRNFSYKTLIWTILLGSIWLTFFWIIYKQSIMDHPERESMMAYWEDYFVPLPSSFSTLIFVPMQLAKFLVRSFISAETTLLVAFTMLAGLLSFREKTNQRYLILLAPTILHIIISLLRLYPFDSQRIILYQFPFLMIWLAFSLDYLTREMISRRAVQGIIIALLSLPMVFSACVNFVKPPMREHIKPVMNYMANRIIPGDNIYVYYGSIKPFEFYCDTYELGGHTTINGIVGTYYPEEFEQELESLTGRTWIILSHEYPREPISVIEELIRTHPVLDKYEGQGARTYLLELD